MRFNSSDSSRHVGHLTAAFNANRQCDLELLNLKEKPNGRLRAMPYVRVADRAELPIKARPTAMAAEKSAKELYVDCQACS
jgi:hypothetical protein